MAKKNFNRIKSSTHHLCLSVQGCLNNHKNKKITFMDDDNGNPVSDAKARLYLNQCVSDGKRVIPIGDCYRFDYQKGCKGHITSLKPNEEMLAKIEREVIEFRNDQANKISIAKNWTEDFHLENGNYQNHCISCGSFFFGYKRRVICKECSNKQI